MLSGSPKEKNALLSRPRQASYRIRTQACATDMPAYMNPTIPLLRACGGSTRRFDLGFVGVEEPGDVFPCAETGC